MKWCKKFKKLLKADAAPIYIDKNVRSIITSGCLWCAQNKIVNSIHWRSFLAAGHVKQSSLCITHLESPKRKKKSHHHQPHTRYKWDKKVCHWWFSNLYFWATTTISRDSFLSFCCCFAIKSCCRVHSIRQLNASSLCWYDVCMKHREMWMNNSAPERLLFHFLQIYFA